MSNALNYIGIAKKAGAIEIGETDSGAACRSGRAKLLLLASDASDNARSRAENFVYGKKTQLLTVPFSKEQLSLQTGEHGCSMAAITDVGLAAVFLSALAEGDESFRQAAQLMDKKKDKALMRKREAKAHDINKKKGKAAKAPTPAKRRNEK